MAAHDPILTVTPNPALDVSTAVEAIDPVIKIRCSPPRHDPGGGGVNAAKAVVALGGSATAVYPSGGVSGPHFDALLEAAGVVARPLRIAGEIRQNLLVFERGTVSNYRFVMPGPELAEADWEALLAEVERSDARWVVASGSLPPGAPTDFYADVAAVARRRGARVLLDGPGEAMRPALASGGVFLIKPNEREFADLTGVADPDGQRERAAELVAAGQAEAVIITRGRRGALLVTADGDFHTPAYPVDHPASATGAGDSFMGALTLALARGWALEDAAAFGAAAAGAAMRTPGTQPPERAETERLYEEGGLGNGRAEQVA